MNNEQPNCWIEYIRRCMIMKTFHVPSSTAAKCSRSIKDALQQLQLLVFPDNLLTSIEVTAEEIAKSDFIIVRLQEAACKNNKLQIQEFQGDSQWTIVEDRTGETPEDDDSKCGETVTCELVVKTKQYVVAIPLNSSGDAIMINGFNHRKGVFDGDI